MHKMRVAVLRGGPSSEYEVSLDTGKAALAHLPDRYEARDILIDRSGVWHMRGFPVDPVRVFDQTDIVLNTLHGTYGEDGTLQRLLDAHKVRYTGSGALASALGMNKPLAKNQLTKAPFKLPLHRSINRDTYTDDVLLDVFRTFPQPSVVKPASGGSSVGTTLARSFQELAQGIAVAFEYGDVVLIEEYIRGREVTVGIIDNFRDEHHYALPPIEIVPINRSFFDYEAKYKGKAREVCPAPLPHATTTELLNAARYVHQVLGLRDYSRTDFIVTKRDVYFLETNTLPGLTEASLIPQALEAVGVPLSQFLDHVVSRALARK